MNDRTYLTGSCGVFLRTVEIPGAASDTRVTRPEIRKLQCVNSFIGPTNVEEIAVQDQKPVINVPVTCVSWSVLENPAFDNYSPSHS